MNNKIGHGSRQLGVFGIPFEGAPAILLDTRGKGEETEKKFQLESNDRGKSKDGVA
jgi:hypothetical protein